MIHKIKSRNIILKEESVLDFIRMNKVMHLKIMAGFDYEVYLKAIYPDDKRDLTLGKDWINIIYRNHAICFRTPRILRKYVGSDIDIIRSTGEFEIFKIRPISFDFGDLLSEFFKKSRLDVPYFTTSGHCVIPDKFMQTNANSSTDKRISFDKMGGDLIEKGYLVFRFTNLFDKNNMSYPLSKCNNGWRTRQLVEIDNKLKIYGKDIRHFQYRSIVKDEECDVVVFQEVIIES